MIYITVGNNEISVEGKLYHSFNEKDNLTEALRDIIERVKYSGETISLWKAQGDKKIFIEEWGTITQW